MISTMELMEKKTHSIKNRHRKKGMTLVEVMAAMAILSILFVGVSGFIINTAKNEGRSERKLESYGYLKNALFIFESRLVECRDGLELKISFDKVVEMQEKIIALQDSIDVNKEYTISIKVDLIDDTNKLYRVYAKLSNVRNEEEDKCLYVYNK